MDPSLALQELRREVRLLRLYALALTVPAVAWILMSLAPQDRPTRFEEIDVERINIVEGDGALRMVISNQERQHSGIVDGVPIPRTHPRPPGILFFNHRGDEAGGLIFGGNGAPDGTGHMVSLTMDKSRHDQTLAMQHLEGDDGRYYTGLRIVDRPHASLADLVRREREIEAMDDEAAREAAYDELYDEHQGHNRVLIGKNRDTSASILLKDPEGRTRLRLRVAPDGAPSLEFLDEAGEVVESLP